MLGSYRTMLAYVFSSCFVLPKYFPRASCSVVIERCDTGLKGNSETRLKGLALALWDMEGEAMQQHDA